GSAPRLLAGGQRLAMALAAGAAAEQLAIDVPPGAASLSASIDGGAGVGLYLSRRPTPEGPDLGLALPREQAVLGAAGNASGSLTLSQVSGLEPGRWYLTPVNESASPAQFALSVNLGGSDVPAPRSGAYF